MKYFTKNVFAFLLAMTMVGLNSATAQIWTYDFGDEAAFATDWVNGGTNDGTETWVWTDDPGTPVFGSQPAFASETVANGFTQFNSDGNGENPHDVTLTTANPIDCSGQSTVFLRSENQYSFFNASSLVQVGVSTDGMVFTYYPVFANVEGGDLSSANQLLIAELPAAANESQVWIQFRWQGNFEYAWKIDDVSLVDADPTPSISYNFGDLFFSPASFAQPILQIATDSMAFDADVTNSGGDEITNVKVVGTITNDGGDILFADSTTVASIPPDSTLNIPLPGLFGPDQLELGAYNFNYLVTADQEEDAAGLADNASTETFLVTEDLWSKDNATETGSRPGDGGDYLMANLYRSSSNLVPGSRYFNQVQFNAAVNAADAPLAGKEVTIILAKVDDDVVDQGWNTFDTNADLTTNEGLDLLAFIPHTFTGDNFAMQMVDLTDFDVNPIEIEPDTRYILGIQYSGDANVVFQGVANAIDYFQISTILYSSQWFLGGFGAENAATIRATTMMDVNAADTPLPAESMSLFPNPTSDNISLDINLEHTGLANIMIGDMTGRIMTVKEYENLANGTYNFDVSKYPNGVYMARLITGEGSRTIKFTVQH